MRLVDSTATATIDRSLTRLHLALSGLLAVEARAAGDITPAEIALELQWREALEPVLVDLYWWPLRNGIDQAPEDEAELRTWLRRRYDDEEAAAALLLLLILYQRRAANVGGRMGLELMGIGGGFDLTNGSLLAELEAHARTLARLDTDLSLLDTTVDDLVRGIPAARAATGNTAQVLAAMIAGWAVTRTGRIAVTEQTRAVGRGLGWVFGRNGVATQRFVTREDPDVCPVCWERHGRIVPVNAVPADMRLPIHIL